MTARPINEDDLQGLVDDRLDPPAGRGRGLSRRQPDARARVERLRILARDLRAAFAPILGEPVPARLNLAHIAVARRRPRLPIRQAAAAALFLTLGGLGGWALHGVFAPVPAGVDALAQEASASFAVYAPDRTRPVELAAGDGDEIAAGSPPGSHARSACRI